MPGAWSFLYLVQFKMKISIEIIVDRKYCHKGDLQHNVKSKENVLNIKNFYHYFLNLIFFFQIREETDTKIDLPKDDSTSDMITITGKKENVEKAKAMLEAIQSEMVSSSLKFLE